LVRPQFKPQFASPAFPTLPVARRQFATSTDGTTSSSTPVQTPEQQEAQRQAAIEAQQQEAHRQEVLQQEIAQSEYNQSAQQEKLDHAQPLHQAHEAEPAQEAATAEQTEAQTPQTKPRPNLPYHVGRTAAGNLALYQKHVRGGSFQVTFVKKITGDREALRAALAAALGLADDAVVLNQLTGNIRVKVRSICVCR
jgi:hypothetical protein